MTAIRVLEKRTYVRDAQGQFAATAASRIAAGRETTIDRSELGDVLDHLAARRDDPNLTLLDVRGTHLFNVGGDHARHDMPQVPSHRKAEFVRDMKADGRTVLRVDLDPLDLKPTQGEISGRAVGQIAKRERGGNPLLTDDAARIVVSSDGYVLDGHHRWAAFAALRITGDSRTIPAFQMAAKRDDALALLRAWGEKAGVQSLALGERARKALDEQAEFEDLAKVRTYVRDRLGRFATTGSSHTTAIDGTPLPEGWVRVDEADRRQSTIDEWRAEGIDEGLTDEQFHKRIFDRMPIETVYTDGAITVRTVGLDDDKHARLVGQVAIMQKVAPLDHATLRIDDSYVTNGAPGHFMGPETFGWTEMTYPGKAGHTVIALRPTVWNEERTRSGSIPFNVGTGSTYALAHEWGHAVPQPKTLGSDKERALYSMFTSSHQVSGYAMSGPAEFYAEMFADWHAGRGTTTRPLVQKAAREFGWYGA